MKAPGVDSATCHPQELPSDIFQPSRQRLFATENTRAEKVAADRAYKRSAASIAPPLRQSLTKEQPVAPVSRVGLRRAILTPPPGFVSRFPLPKHVFTWLDSRSKLC